MIIEVEKQPKRPCIAGCRLGTLMEELRKTWALAKEGIRPQISPVTFHRWIEALDPVTVQSGILVMEAPDDVVKNTVSEYYLDYVRSALQKADPEILDVLLIVPSQRRDFVQASPDEVSLNSLTLTLLDSSWASMSLYRTMGPAMSCGKKDTYRSSRKKDFCTSASSRYTSMT